MRLNLRKCTHSRAHTVQDGGSPCQPHYVKAATRECVAPIISISKDVAGTDVVAPMMLLPDANVTWRHAPWAAKAPKAFFRGAPSCGELTFEKGVCGRTWVARMAQMRPDLLDAGECRPRGWGRAWGWGGSALWLASGQWAPTG